MKGSCLCGSAVYEVTPPFKLFQYCHCSRCRKFTGSAHSTSLFVPKTQFKWLENEELIENYDLEAAKYFSTSFCKICGSSMPWAVKGTPNMVIPAGALDEDPGCLPTQSIYCGSSAPWLVESSSLPGYEQLPTRK